MQQLPIRMTFFISFTQSFRQFTSLKSWLGCFCLTTFPSQLLDLPACWRLADFIWAGGLCSSSSSGMGCSF